jgi:hypothetical protein
VARAPPPPEDDEVQEYVPVKSEPMAAAPQQQQPQYEEPGGKAPLVLERSDHRFAGGMVMTTEDSMQYDENYGAYEEEGYDEGGYYQEGAGQEGSAGMFQLFTKAKSLLVDSYTSSQGFHLLIQYRIF